MLDPNRLTWSRLPDLRRARRHAHIWALCDPDDASADCVSYQIFVSGGEALDPRARDRRWVLVKSVEALDAVFTGRPWVEVTPEMLAPA